MAGFAGNGESVRDRVRSQGSRDQYRLLGLRLCGRRRADYFGANVADRRSGSVDAANRFWPSLARTAAGAGGSWPGRRCGRCNAPAGDRNGRADTGAGARCDRRCYRQGGRKPDRGRQRGWPAIDARNRRTRFRGVQGAGARGQHEIHRQGRRQDREPQRFGDQCFQPAQPGELMPHAELDRLEGDVRDARRRLKSDLEILRAPETFSSFKEEVLDEARRSRDDIVANVKTAATDRAERLVADIKERAAANPVAIGTIAAGVAWRILRKPPITTMLVGYGLISLWRTKPGQPAPGAETVYRAADMAIEAKEQVEQWGSEAADAIARATDVVVPAATATVQRWSADAGDAVSQATTSVQSLVASGSQSLEHIVTDKQERDKVLLGAAAVALTAALGPTCLRRAQTR